MAAVAPISVRHKLVVVYIKGRAVKAATANPNCTAITSEKQKEKCARSSTSVHGIVKQFIVAAISLKRR